MQSRCPRCSGPTWPNYPCHAGALLFPWTTQGFPPSFDYKGDPAGASFEPYGVGLVQLDDVVRVEARLTENDPEKLDFGMEVELRIIPYYSDEDGNEIITFAFAPVETQNNKEH